MSEVQAWFSAHDLPFAPATAAALRDLGVDAVRDVAFVTRDEWRALFADATLVQRRRAEWAHGHLLREERAATDVSEATDITEVTDCTAAGPAAPTAQTIAERGGTAKKPDEGSGAQSAACCDPFCPYCEVFSHCGECLVALGGW